VDTHQALIAQCGSSARRWRAASGVDPPPRLRPPETVLLPSRRLPRGPAPGAQNKHLTCAFGKKGAAGDSTSPRLPLSPLPRMRAV